MLVNVIQATIMLFALKKTNTRKIMSRAPDAIGPFEIVLFLSGLVYTVSCFMGSQTAILQIIFASVILLTYILVGVFEKRYDRLLYLLFICVIPGIISGALNSLYYNGLCFSERWGEDLFVWASANFILLASFGFVALEIFRRPDLSNQNKRKDSMVKLSTILYYLSLMAWNFLFFAMFVSGWLYINTMTYIFPWFIGNMFLVLNLIFSQKEEISDLGRGDVFKWLEERAVVVEKNTQMLMSVITFLLPISAAIMDKLSSNIVIIFVLNISFAVASIGLIWVPSGNIKFMSLLKTLKTIFHLFTLSLLLLNAIMIVNSA